MWRRRGKEKKEGEVVSITRKVGGLQRRDGECLRGGEKAIGKIGLPLCRSLPGYACLTTTYELMATRVAIYSRSKPETVGKNSSFKSYKPQLQGVSFSTWGVVRRKLCSKYWN